MKVAIIHDWLVTEGGAEHVLEELILMYPNADLYSLVCFLSDSQRHFLHGKQPKTSFIQTLPYASKHYRTYLALMPIAIEQFDLSSYDLIISSSYAVAKGVIVGPDQIHISYVHSPVRYAWDLQHSYLREKKLDKGLRSLLARVILHYIRIWDYRTATGVDQFVANSQFIARRIRKVYGREAAIVHPPVDTTEFTTGSKPKEEFYLTASRLVPYKHVPMIVEAFTRMPERRLIVIGDGPEMPAVRALATENVTVLGYQAKSVLIDYMQRAKAFVFAAEEDFGIAPIEAQACGTPVIAFGKGGIRETIISQEGPSQTGMFFDSQTPDAIVAAVSDFHQRSKHPSSHHCRENAKRFSKDNFRASFRQVEKLAMAASPYQNNIVRLVI